MMTPTRRRVTGGFDTRGDTNVGVVFDTIEQRLRPFIAEHFPALLGLELVTKGSIQAAIFSADDLDATFERIRASGTAEVLQEPKSQPWGVRDCAFRDPSGNLVRIAQA